MNKILAIVLCTVSSLGVATAPTHAADTPPAQVLVVNDSNNYQGDLLTFPVNVVARFGDATSAVVCIPAKTALRGVSTATDGSLNVRIDPNQARGFWPRFWRAVAFWESHDDRVTSLRFSNPAPGFSSYTSCVQESIDGLIGRKGTPLQNVILNNAVLNVPKSVVDQSKPNRFGLSYGGLLVPFKYHFTGSQQFNTNTTIAPYLGYRLDRESLGRSIEFIAFVGAAPISVSGNSNGQTTNQTLAGFSYGGGIIGKLKDAFQWGVVVGVDRVSGGATYEDNGKPWVALELGYSFSQ